MMNIDHLQRIRERNYIRVCCWIIYLTYLNVQGRAPSSAQITRSFQTFFIHWETEWATVLNSKKKLMYSEQDETFPFGFKITTSAISRQDEERDLFAGAWQEMFIWWRNQPRTDLMAAMLGECMNMSQRQCCNQECCRRRLRQKTWWCCAELLNIMTEMIKVKSRFSFNFHFIFLAF